MEILAGVAISTKIETQMVNYIPNPVPYIRTIGSVNNGPQQAPHF